MALVKVQCEDVLGDTESQQRHNVRHEKRE